MPAFAEACGPLAENVINIGGFPDYGLLYGYTNLIKLQSALIAKPEKYFNQSELPGGRKCFT